VKDSNFIVLFYHTPNFADKRTCFYSLNSWKRIAYLLFSLKT